MEGFDRTQVLERILEQARRYMHRGEITEKDTLATLFPVFEVKSHPAYAFEACFNKTCKELGYDPRLIPLWVFYPKEFDTGDYAVETVVKGIQQLALNSHPMEKRLISLLEINLLSNDVTLSKVMDLIADAYKKTRTGDSSCRTRDVRR